MIFKDVKLAVAVIYLSLNACVLSQSLDEVELSDGQASAYRSKPPNSRQAFDQEAQESRGQEYGDSSEGSKHYFLAPGSITNSHRPQYYQTSNTGDASQQTTNQNRNTLDKIKIINQNNLKNHRPNPVVVPKPERFNGEVDLDDEDYRPTNHLLHKQNQIKAVLVKILEKSEHKRKFAEVLPILKVMSPAQRLAMASLVTNQLTADTKNPGLSLAQVKAMFGNDPNITADLMLPIMLDIANMFRAAKDQLKVHGNKMPHAQLLRRSFSDSEELDPTVEPFEASEQIEEFVEEMLEYKQTTEEPPKSMKIAAKLPSVNKNTAARTANKSMSNEIPQKEDLKQKEDTTTTVAPDKLVTLIYSGNSTDGIKNVSVATNGTEDLPTAEKLRAHNRYIDRNGNLVILARPPWGTPPAGVGAGALLPPPLRRPAEPLLAAQRRRVPPSPSLAALAARQSLLELARHKCDLFTTSLCLETLDYPVEAISASIRRNQAAMGALLADFPAVSADSAIDGVSAQQEQRYTPEHYMNTINRREDDGGVVSPVGVAGFMCPSTVKYARPQKARATSGQWKYIVNTGEHTQTLRLEKCMRPREPCTYLTDNFKSKCVQVYNYHRLLTWDQQNGLHMDIFKVPTCCSCHIEGYSISFPPHSNRPKDPQLEHFPGQELSHEPEENPYEDVQSSIRHTTTHTAFGIPQTFDKYPPEHQNFITGSTFHHPTFAEDPSLHDLKHLPVPNQFDSVNGNFHTDILQHQGSSIRNSKKPNPIRSANNALGLPSFLEPPSKPPAPVLNTYLKSPEQTTKYKPFAPTHFKRGAAGTQGTPVIQKRPIRRPIRKKNSQAADDQLVGSTNIHETPTIINMETFEDINDSVEDFDMPTKKPVPTPTTRYSTPKTFHSSSKFTIKNVSPSTTEKYHPKPKPIDQESNSHKDASGNRRVNYNYHPIIDFFEGGSKKETEVASDRVDSETLFLDGLESDWRPMAGPVSPPQHILSSNSPASSKILRNSG